MGPFFPDVPVGLGIPAISRPPGFSFVRPPLMTADAANLPGAARAPNEWGLFLNGAPVVVAATVTAFEYRRDWLLSDYQVERGAFETYNKVQTPADLRLRFAAGDDEAARTALLESAEQACGSFSIDFEARTPEKTYKSINPTHHSYRRMARNGVGLIIVDVWCYEVRVNATAKFSNTKAPSGADPRAGGNVQPRVPSAATASKLRGFEPSNAEQQVINSGITFP